MITYFILFVTTGISLVAFNNRDLAGRLIFNAFAIQRYNEWYRFITHGVLHGDFMHLFFNMLSLYFFGPFVEETFKMDVVFGETGGTLMYLLLYIGALIVSSIYSFFKHRDHSWYNALGASGAVSAVIFAAILLNPLGTLYVYFIPMQSWIFGILYLGFSWYMGRRGGDNIGHDAHFWGAVYGFVLPVIFKYELFQGFVFQLKMFFLYGGVQ